MCRGLREGGDTGEKTGCLSPFGRAGYPDWPVIRRSRNGRIMRRMRFLIIDEVSMVRSDLMWAIDQSLRVNRGRAREPFGGVRLILFGDLHQLPPVVRGAEEAQHLEETYGGPFFFSVPALTESAGTHLIELNHAPHGLEIKPMNIQL
mgnify:CR=1 FL=1